MDSGVGFPSVSSDGKGVAQLEVIGGTAASETLAGGSEKAYSEENEGSVEWDEEGGDDPAHEALNLVLHRVYLTSTLQVIRLFSREGGGARFRLSDSNSP